MGMYVVTCATSRTGSIVVQRLLEAGRKVRVVVRDPRVAEAFAARSVDVALADYADVDAMTSALRGAEAAYVIPPPLPVTAEGHHVYRIDRTRTLARALHNAAVGHVVSLSSFAAQHPDGTGMIKSCHACEQLLDEESGAAVTHLRPAFFLDNWAAQLPAALEGVFPSFLGPVDRRFTMVGTADIAAVATRLLLEPSSAGRIVQLSGSTDYSIGDIAQAFARVLGRAVVPAILPIETMADSLVERGFSRDTATNYQELFAGMMTGHVALDPQLPIERGTLGLVYAIGAMVRRVRASA